MRTITEREADDWIAGMKPEQVRKIVQEYHALKQGLCYQSLLVPTGADDWVERSISAARRLRQCETELRKLVYAVENACAEARNSAEATTCGNCVGTGIVNDNSCCICRGTGLRRLD